MDGDLTKGLVEAVAAAHESRRPLRVVGGSSKLALGMSVDGEPLEVAGHRGIVGYEPTELVITARSGTPLADIEAALAAEGQMLGCEPPHLGPGATIGGTVACGLSGPRRPWAGSVRDFVLGTRIVNGRGQALRFGGEVIKNVAGYDLSRLMTGAQGTLGVLLEVSLRVLPIPEQETTVTFAWDVTAALAALARWGRQPLPLSAACHDGERLHVRLSGTTAGVRAAVTEIGGDRFEDAGAWWSDLRERRLPFFDTGDTPLWRLAAAPAAAQPDDLSGSWLVDWGGAQRWLRSGDDADTVRAAATRLGGHATRVTPGAGNPFQPLPRGLHALHRRLKEAFDPHAILNPGRLYADL